MDNRLCLVAVDRPKKIWQLVPPCVLLYSANEINLWALYTFELVKADLLEMREDLLIEALPPEILLYILKFIPLKDLLQSFCLVSKYFLFLSEENSIWKSLCQTRWRAQFDHAYEHQKHPFTISQIEQQCNFRWKQYFIQKYLIEKGLLLLILF